MPRVRCLGCNGDYDLDDLGAQSPVCPLCHERHPFDRAPLEDAGGTIVFSRIAIVIVVVAVVGLAITWLLPGPGPTYTGTGAEGQPIGPFETSGPWTLRWECDANPRTVSVFQHVGDEEPKEIRNFGKWRLIPYVGEREIPKGGRYSVRFHPKFEGEWTVQVIE